jgi:hypothetical protein
MLAFAALVIASLVVVLAAVGSVAVATIRVASATPTPTATPVSTPSPSPSPSPSPTPIPTPTPSPTPTPVPTLRPAPAIHEYLVAAGTEPGSAANPFLPGVVAVVSENITWSTPKNGCSRPAVRVSQDGGATWSAPAYPWGTRCQDIHALVAWGPNGRLWAGNAVGTGSGVAMSVTHSDDMGKTWSKPWVEHFNPPWVGCFPSLTVDDWPGSVNFGTVYVAFNWLPNSYGPGVSLMASRDGTNWVHTEVPLGPNPKGFPFSWRLGYRIEAAPDGSAYVSYYESDLKKWSSANIFNESWGSNIGRRGYAIARVHFDGTKMTADPPTWVANSDIAETQFQSGLAIDGNSNAWLAIENKGKISFGEIGGTRVNISVAGMYNFKPSLAISGDTFFLGWHAKDKGGRIWTYYAISYDGGKTFGTPAVVTRATWKNSAAPDMNGVGLREDATFSGGTVYYAYGDARSGLGVYMAVIKP